MSKVNNDVYLSIILILVSIYAFVQSFSMPTDSAQFPLLISAPLFLMSLILLITSLKKPKEKKESSIEKNKVKKITLTVLVMIGYILIIDLVGYLISSLFLFYSVLLLMGYRKYKTGVIMSVVIVSIIFVMFAVFLKVPLPKILS